jgi:hypothetical protein
MARDVHHDGGQLRETAVAHRHVVENADGSVSAIVVRGVPALVCDLCEEAYCETETTDAVLQLLRDTEVAPGQAIAVDFAPREAA